MKVKDEANDRVWLLSEKNALERMLNNLPESCVIDRMSLEARKEKVEEELGRLPTIAVRSQKMNNVKAILDTVNKAIRLVFSLVWGMFRTLPGLVQLVLLAAIIIMIWSTTHKLGKFSFDKIQDTLAHLIGKTTELSDQLFQQEMENQRRFDWLVANQSVAVATTEYVTAKQLRDIIREEVNPAIQAAVKARDQKITEVANTIASKASEISRGQANVIRSLELLPGKINMPQPIPTPPEIPIPVPPIPNPYQTPVYRSIERAPEDFGLRRMVMPTLPPVYPLRTPVGDYSGRAELPTPTPVVREAYEYELIWSATDGMKLPIGALYFRPYRKDDQCTVFWYDTDFHFKLTEAVQRDGKTAHYSEAYVTVPRRNGYENVRFPLPITSSEVFVQEPKTREFMFAPALSLGGVAYGGKDGFHYGGDVGVSFWGYGRTKKDLDWMFLRLGLGGGGDEVIGTISPVMYRVPLPLTSGIYFWPTVGYGSKSEFLGGGALGIRF